MLSPPARLELPLFVYGMLKPGEIAYPQVERYILTADAGHVTDHRLQTRDGLPLLIAEGDGVEGFVLTFNDPEAGYKVVCAFEPRKLYKWSRPVQVDVDGRTVAANVLLGRYPDAGVEHEHARAWSSAEDPVFAFGIPTAAEMASAALADLDAATDVQLARQAFRLHAAYLLLMSAVERLATLRFGAAREPGDRIRALDDDQQMRGWVAAAAVSTADRIVFDSRNAQALRMAADGSNAWRFWYQVRSNLVHRGKGVDGDVALVRESFIDVHDVMRLALLELAPDLRRAWRTIDPERQPTSWRLREASGRALRRQAQG